MLVRSMVLPTQGHGAAWFAGGGTVGITLCSWQELNSELRQHQEDLTTLEHLAAELSSCGFAPGASQQEEKLQSLKKDFLQLQKVAKER